MDKQNFSHSIGLYLLLGPLPKKGLPVYSGVFLFSLPVCNKSDTFSLPLVVFLFLINNNANYRHEKYLTLGFLYVQNDGQLSEKLDPVCYDFLDML